MATKNSSRKELLAENKRLLLRLDAAEETLRAVGSGEVDAFAISGPDGPQVFTLRGAEQPYRVLVETMNEGAVTLAADGTILYCNNRLAALLEIPQERLAGTALSSYVAPACQALFAARLEHCATGCDNDEIDLITGHGASLPVLICCSPLELPGNPGLSIIVTDLRQQKRNEEILAARRLAQSIIEQAGEAIVVCDSEGIIIQASRLAEQLCGKSPLLKPFNEMFLLRSKGTESPFSVVTLLEGVCFKNLEVEFRRGDDQTFHLLLNATPLKSDHDRSIGCVVTLTDITERKRSELVARRFYATLEGMNEVLSAALTCQTEEELGIACLEIAQKLTQSTFGFLSHVGPEGLEPTAMSIPGWDACSALEVKGHVFKIRGLFGRVVTGARAFFSNDLDQELDRVGLPPGHPPLDSFLGTPLVHESEVIGLISVANRPGGYSAFEQETLEALAPVVVEAFLRKRAEQALRESELRFRLALKNSPVSVAIQDRDLVYQWAYNQQTRRPDEIVGKTDADLFAPEDVAWILAAKLQVLESGSEVHLEHWLTSNGIRMFLDLSCEPLRDAAGKLTGIGLAVVNLTKQKLAEEALRQSEERYRLLADTMLQGVVHQDVNGRIIAMNPAAERILGKTRAEFLGASSLQEEQHCIRENGQPFPGQDHPSMVALRTGLPVRGVIMGVFNPKLRAHRWIGIDAVPVFRPGETQPSQVYTVFGDITERRQAQEELRLNTERFQVSLKGSPITAFNQNLDLRYTWVYNPALGYEVAEVIGRQDSDLFERPGDAAVTDAIKQEVIRSGAGRRQEVMILSRGVERCYDLIVDPLLDQDGQIVGVTCAAIDLTKRKQAEEELRQKEERLRLALDAARLAAWDWHMPSDQVVWNEMHYAMLGYLPGAVPPSYQAWASRVHPDDFERVRQKIAECIEEHKVYGAEFRTLCPDGDVRWLEARGEIEYDANNQPQRFYGVMADITERKRIEDELRGWNEELENRVAERTAQLAASVESLKLENAERRSAEESIMRLNRLFAVLSETNQAIVHTRDRETLFRQFCSIAVGAGSFRLAWVGLLDQNGRVRIVAADGATGYLDGITISAGEEPEGSGPTGLSLREGTNFICNDFLDSPFTLPWHERGRAFGIASSASIALKQEGRVIGALTLYSDKKDFFDHQQVGLLQQMGADVSFALDNMVLERRSREAERALREEATERLCAVEALREKEQLLIQQSRLAAMGEMIGNIAHQWRQPLNLLGLTAQQLLLLYDLGEFDRAILAENVQKEMEIIQHMSQTIDDFRDYFQPDKEKCDFKVREVVANTLSLLSGSLQGLHIGVEIIAQDDPIIHGYPNEFAQVLLNIVINAKDILMEREIEHPKVTITTFSAGGSAVVTVADNGGGIPEEVVGKVFDPYFTTKGPQRGTGVGLFMSKNIIEKNMGGKLSVRNLDDGAEFRVEV